MAARKDSKVWKPGELARFINDYKSGMKYLDICKKYNVSVGSIQYYLKREKVEKRESAFRRPWTPEDYRRVTEMRLAGMTLREIAKVLKRTREAIDSALVRDKEKRQATFKKRKVKKTRRQCLKCDRMFLSEGIYNRVCPLCRESNAIVREGWE